MDEIIGHSLLRLSEKSLHLYKSPKNTRFLETMKG